MAGMQPITERSNQNRRSTSRLSGSAERIQNGIPIVESRAKPSGKKKQAVSGSTTPARPSNACRQRNSRSIISFFRPLSRHE